MKRHCPLVKCISFTFLLYQIITIIAVLNRTCLSYLWRSESERVFLSKNQAVKSLCSRVATLADPFPSLCRAPEAILTSWFTASYHLQSYQWPGNSFVQCHLSSLVSFASSTQRYLQLQQVSPDSYNAPFTPTQSKNNFNYTHNLNSAFFISEITHFCAPGFRQLWGSLMVINKTLTFVRLQTENIEVK